MGAAASVHPPNTVNAAPAHNSNPPLQQQPLPLVGVWAAIAKLKPVIEMGSYQRAELEWQSKLAGDEAKCLHLQFRDEVLSQQGIKVFGWMSQGSPYMQIMHSAAGY